MEKKNVVVIGGGILGLTHAYSLAKAGFSVTLLERNTLASAASGGNLGQWSLIDRLEPWHMKLSLAAMKMYRELPEEFDPEFEQTGAAILICEDEEFALAEKLIADLSVYGIPGEIITDRERIHEMEPGLDLDQVLGIFFCPWEGVINPLNTVEIYRQLALSAGAELLEHTPVTGFEMEEETAGNGTGDAKGEAEAEAPRRIRAVVTPDKTIEADYVINCAGSWASDIAELAGTRTQLHWRRGSALVTQAYPKIIQGQLNNHTLLRGLKGVIGGDGSELISMGLVQAKNGTLLIAQVTKFTDKESRDLTSGGITKMVKKFLGFFPSCKDLMAVRVWSAVTPLSDDENPFYGFYEKVPNLVAAAGFKGAFTTAPAVAEETAKLLLTGESELVLPELAPERPVWENEEIARTYGML